MITPSAAWTLDINGAISVEVNPKSPNQEKAQFSYFFHSGEVPHSFQWSFISDVKRSKVVLSTGLHDENSVIGSINPFSAQMGQKPSKTQKM